MGLGGGIAREAAACLLVLSSPGLAALEWEPWEGHHRAPLAEPPPGRPGFESLPPGRTGIGFVNRLETASSLTNQVLLNGSGVALADVDGDGLCDLYLCGLETPNRLYRNLGGWRFADLTGTSGTACGSQASTGAAFADVDGDGDMDLLVAGLRAGVRLFLNQGGFRFEEATGPHGLGGDAGATSMALGDADGDGWLDLYAVHYRNATFRDDPEAEFDVRIEGGTHRLLAYNGRPVSLPELQGRFSLGSNNGILENGQADAFYRGLGGGRFGRVPWDGSVFREGDGSPSPPPYDWGLSAQMRDLDGDSHPDLYVCNDFQSPDRIWINDGRGGFRPIAPEAIGQTSLFSMGADAADIDRDGHDDIFVADMLSPRHADRMVQVMEPSAFAQYRDSQGARPQYPRNTLLLSRGDGTYAEIARLARLDASYWSWCPVFLDVDLDGLEDLLVTTGHWRDAQNADISMEIDRRIREGSLRGRARLEERRRFPRLETPNVAFANRGGLLFEEKGAEWGFDSRRISHGMALADLDQDGDSDVVVNCLNAPPLVLRNTGEAPRIRVVLSGRPPNTRGIGARIVLDAPDLPPQSQEILAGGRYLSSGEPARSFACPRGPAGLRVEWRSGEVSLAAGVAPGWIYRIGQDRARAADAPGEGPAPLFADASSLLEHVHQDTPFNDRLLQALLPRRSSESGPGISWFDYNRDGWEDLFVGGGRGGRLGVFRNDGGLRFVRQRSPLFSAPLQRDHGTVLGRLDPHSLLLCLANLEPGGADEPALEALSLADGTLRREILPSPASHGPMALGDADGDGRLDLFVGAHRLPGRYPLAPGSRILKDREGTLAPDPEASRPFGGAGMVSSALFTHLDGDGLADLVLAGEWAPLRLYRQREGRLEPWDPPVRPHGVPLSRLPGLFNSVASGDFDGDGRLDLAAGNMGRNTAWPRRRLYYQARPSGTLPLLEAYYSRERDAWLPVHERDRLAGSFPALRGRWKTHRDYAGETMESLLEEHLPPMEFLEARLADSVVLLHRGDHYLMRPLPLEAQFAPVFGLDAGDVDGDGDIDIALAQNLWSASSIYGRQDAGSALILLNDGRGRFHALPPSRSGVASRGQGRGLALCDFDGDGRLDLAAGQHRGPTRLWRNQGAEPLVRLRLQGPPSNPGAVGARVRPASGGPVQEISAGGGYWSQRPATLLVPRAESLEIHWPGGGVQALPVPAGAAELSGRHPGSRE